MNPRLHTCCALLSRAAGYFWSAVRVVVLAFAVVAGLASLATMAIICADVVLRALGRSFTGAYDVVRFAGTLAIAGALPYTTAVKGHVAVEYFFHKLHRVGRILVDTLCRVIVAGLFSLFTWQCLAHGHSLRRTGEVSLTLGLPLFWLAYVIALACLLTTLVVLHNLLHPGKEMIKP